MRGDDACVGGDASSVCNVLQPSPPFNSMRVVHDGDACTTHHAAFVLQVSVGTQPRDSRESMALVKKIASSCHNSTSVAGCICFNVKRRHRECATFVQGAAHRFCLLGACVLSLTSLTRTLLPIPLVNRSRCVRMIHSTRCPLTQPQFYDDICEMLVTAGYFRARISTLPPFDKILGGLTWFASHFMHSSIGP